MRRFSLEGKLTLLLVLAVSLGAAVAIALDLALESDRLALLLALLLVVPAAVFVARALIRPVSELFRTLSGAVTSFRDGDFSFSIHSDRRDELGDLVAAHNELGRVLRDERQNLFQRELLLHTVVQNTPTALLLVDAADHIVYGNTAARQLLNGGRKIEGVSFATICAESPPALADAVRAGADGIFSTSIDGNDEAFHIAQRDFQLNGRPHRLFLFKRLTRELSRQEVATWKKVIRVISHELNNSLAPISSLAHSGKQLLATGDTPRLQRVFDTIAERTRHLDGFIRGYATFAKLPTPRLEPVAWPEFLASLAEHCAFVLVQPAAQNSAYFDPAQISQVLINLTKNAHESGSPAADIEIEVRDFAKEVHVEVRDRGTGMSETVLANALVPFYSTKRSGTGLGLALVREIVDAHGGRMALTNRAGGGLAVSFWLPQRR